MVIGATATHRVATEVAMHPDGEAASAGEALEHPNDGAEQQELVPVEAAPVPEPAMTTDPLLIGGVVVAALLLVGLLWVGVRRLARPAALPPAAPTPEEVPPERVTEAPTAPAVQPAEVVVPGLLERLQVTVGRSRAVLQERFDALFRRDPRDPALFEELEEALLAADVGVPTTEQILSALREHVRRADPDPDGLRAALRQEVRNRLQRVHQPLRTMDSAPWVILVVGVNGSGKTTTIGKLAARLVSEGRRVLLAAGDTFRAAAAEQLQIWSQRAGADIVAHQSGADPGAVVYDALQAARARGHDVVIVDTAGRLQTRKPLMEQLSKVRRVLGKVVPGAPHETLLVMDGTMGQNALSQARLFHEATPLTGVVVTKLDGTAKGGMIVAVADELALPVKLIGLGEQVDDLREFEVDAFVEALF